MSQLPTETVVEGWIIGNVNGDKPVMWESFNPKMGMTVANFLFYAEKIGWGKKSWPAWQKEGYRVRRATLTLEEM